MRDELSILSAFLTVAEERSFTRAAKKLNISTSGVSHAIRRRVIGLGGWHIGQASVSERDSIQRDPAGHRPRRGGAIVNTSSGAVIVGIKGSPAYTAARHGVIGLTRAAALDYAAQNIRVNAVCPGYIETPMMDRSTGGTAEGRAKVISEEPIGRMGRAEEIANAVPWLYSEATFTVGHALVVDGGQTVQ